MSPFVLLTALLALAFIGSMLVSGHSIRGFGLPSGSEFLVLGVLVGPRFLGVVTRESLEGFESLTLAALAWLTFAFGSDYGYVGRKRVSLDRMLTGLGLSALTGLCTAGPAVVLAFALTDLAARDVLVLGLGVAAVSAETTRHAMRWVAQRYSADGPLTKLLADLSEADDALPILMLAVVAAILPQEAALALPGLPWSGLAATVGIGGALGATCAALFDIEPRYSQRWGILLGTGLLCIGVSLRLGLSAPSATFIMGIVATALAKERGALQSLLGSTERASMLPALVLAGVHIVIPPLMPFALIAVSVLGARVLAKLLSGRVVSGMLEPKTRRSPSLGLGLLPAGVLSIVVGLAFVIRFPGQASEWILALAALNALAGELLGTVFLRRELRAAGEISPLSVAPSSRPPARPTPEEERAAARLIRTTTGRSGSTRPPPSLIRTTTGRLRPAPAKRKP